jgi:radical SAM-linked protein
MKMLILFQKQGAMRFIGHLDLQRAMQRALRRSGLPVTYSQGFNPHLMLSFAAPLAVGIAGEREIMEVPLEGDVSEDSFLNRLNEVLPIGLRAVFARALASDTSAAMARLFAAQYTLEPLEEAEALLAAVPGFLAQEAIPYLRRSKSGEKMDDLRPMVFNLRAKEGKLYATLSLNEKATAKPDQLLVSLADFAGLPIPRCLITRTALLDSRFAPLENA